MTNDTSAIQQQLSDGMGNAGEGQNEEGGRHEEETGGEKNNNMDNAKQRLEDFDWEGLEERFWERMEECRKVEEGIMGEFKELVEVGFISSICF